ncbi:uncharacterized protein [Parasteatoda tepidariorum]|uniref:uncharacterized protein n=1 Tax=Parasteatoda tepidariorum TaxID=114398 RepID=UPI001C723016|nr:uncharacterized protein LOC107449520 [Parasteatoda tepidariorum]
MRLLEYLVFTIGFFHHHVNAKAFWASKDNVKGTYGHMNENLYLKEVSGGYEMRYVPHVDGKPIFIPFGENITPPNILKARPTKMYQNYIPKSPFEPNVKQKELPSEQLFPTSEYIKIGKDSETKQTKVDHPLVIDVVTKANHLKYDHDTVTIRPVKRKPEVTKAIKIKSSEHGKKHLKHKTYETDGYAVKETQTDSFIRFDPVKVPKHEVKEKTPINYEKKDGILIHQDHHSPTDLESLTKEIFEKQTENIKNEVINKKPFPQYHNEKLEAAAHKLQKESISTGQLFQASEYIKMGKDSRTKQIHADHPLVIDVVTKVNHLKNDHDTVIIRPEKKKPEVTKAIKIKSSEQGFDPAKVSKHEVKEKTPNNYENKDEILIHQDHNSQTYLESLAKEISKKQTENIKDEVINKKPFLQYHNEKLDTKISEEESKFGNNYEDNKDVLTKSQNEMEAVDYEEMLENKSIFHPIERDQDYDSPVIVEALVKKNQDSENPVNEMYDSPVIIEALVKKEDFTKKYPVKDHSIKSHDPVVLDARLNKNPNKHNEEHVKYSTEMEYFPSHLEKLPPSHLEKLPPSHSKQDIESSESFTNEDLFIDDNEQFDAGSGLLNERASETFSNSNFWPVLPSFLSQERNKFKKCTTSNDEPGNCMPIQLCPTPNFQLTLDDLIKKLCPIDELFIGICCPEFPAEILKVDWENVSSNDQEPFETKSEECGKMQEESDTWPWMAPLISVSTRKIFCGSILINPRYVLTAAHCTRKIPHNQIVVVLGPSSEDSNPQEYEVIEIKRHAQYNARTMQYDIALLKLSRKVSRPFICLPREESFVGETALMLGWRGTFTASKIEEKLLVLSSRECSKGIGDILCTEPRTEDVMCNVDSGAPLIIKHNERYEVIGLLTWNRNDCNFPALFTRISHFKGWIENHSSF